ncbi:MAG: hypothetical protein R3B39_02925 [Candidatus Paceibacterota bacterium]
MKKIGCIRCIPIEKIGIGKWEFCRFPGGRIVVYKINDDKEESVVGEYKNVGELKSLGPKIGFYGADLSFVCRFLS